MGEKSLIGRQKFNPHRSIEFPGKLMLEEALSPTAKWLVVVFYAMDEHLKGVYADDLMEAFGVDVEAFSAAFLEVVRRGWLVVAIDGKVEETEAFYEWTIE